MNKTDLVNALSEKTGIIKKDAKDMVDSVLEIITDNLKNDEKVSLSGFGTFKLVDRKERTGHNPRTGEEIKIPARKVLKFMPAKSLKDEVK